MRPRRQARAEEGAFTLSACPGASTPSTPDPCRDHLLPYFDNADNDMRCRDNVTVPSLSLTGVLALAGREGQSAVGAISGTRADYVRDNTDPLLAASAASTGACRGAMAAC